MIDLTREIQANLFFEPSLTQEADFSVQMQIPKSLPYFSGHFPNNPVLPAIAMIDITEFLLKAYLKRPLSLKKVKNLKIKKPIAPDEKVMIRFHKVADDQFEISWASGTTETRDSKIADLSLIFR